MGVDGLAVVTDSLGEPHLELVLGGLGRVGSVADVPAEVNGEVSADASGLGGEWLQEVT